jgi:hypothetical protein
MRDHAAIEELIATQALGGLERPEQSALAAERSTHGEGCEECLRLENAYAEVAGRLAFALEPTEIREGLEDELVARARSAPEQATLRAARPDDARSVGAARAGRAVSRIVAAAVTALLLFAAGAAGYLLAPRGDTLTEEAAAYLAEPATQVVHMTDANVGNVTIAYQPGRPESFLLGSSLQAAPSGKTYELWMIRGTTPVPGGCFSPTDGGLVKRIDADPSGAQEMAVTVEPEQCSKAPTSKPILSAPL